LGGGTGREGGAALGKKSVKRRGGGSVKEFDEDLANGGKRGKVNRTTRWGAVAETNGPEAEDLAKR